MATFTEQLKAFAIAAGADLVGIAPMERFQGAPKQMDPRYIFPEAKALIGLGFRIPRGCFRGIEEGTYFISYATMGYADINLVTIPTVLRKVSLHLEDNGWEAVPIPMAAHFAAISDVDAKLLKRPTVSVSPEKPIPDVLIHFRIAAVAAGMGEIGYSGNFLSPEFGPRQRLAFVLTDAPLEPDPLFEGEICDRCMVCVKRCPAKAISATNTVKVDIGGKECEWAQLDQTACSIAYAGGVREISPFLPPGVSFDLHKTAAERSGDGRPDLRHLLPFADATLSTFHHWPAIGGARGCIRACMDHLEKEGKLKAKFHAPFPRKQPWSLSDTEKGPEESGHTDAYGYSHY